jgi:glycosyltransferase involved in cell wall biosynthesis
MRVLAISFCLPPGSVPQAVQIGRLLANLPAQIGIIGGQADQLGPNEELSVELNQRLTFRQDVAFRPFLSGFAATLARRFVPFWGRIPDECRHWVPLAEKSAVMRLQTEKFQPDLIATFGEPMSDHLVGLRLKSQLGIPWIAHFSDPWADSAFRRYEFLAQFVNARLEAQVIEAADQLVFTSEETLGLVMRKYPKAWRTKAEVLPHSFNPALYSRPTKPSGPLVVRYLGSFYGHRSPVPLFRALKFLLTREPNIFDNVQFELVGSLPGRMRMYPSLRGLPTGLVRLRDPVSYLESLKLMSASDLLLVIDGPDDLSVFLPSKLIDYLGARVPIFGIVPPGASAKLLSRLGAPIADPRNPEQIATALRRALKIAADRRLAANWQRWGDPEILDEYDIGSVSKAFFQIMQNTLQRSQQGTVHEERV